MAIVRYEPWNLLKQLSSVLEPEMLKEWEKDQSNVVTSTWTPAVDIREEKDRFVVTADIPGVEPKDIEITMEQGILSVKGERKVETEEEREGYHRIERARGTFYRRFSLPDSADASSIKASGKNGVLEITIPKQAKVLPKRILVES